MTSIVSVGRQQVPDKQRKALTGALRTIFLDQVESAWNESGCAVPQEIGTVEVK